MADIPLTAGAIPRMMIDKKILENCILQIVDSKPVAGDRFRITVSDGTHTQAAMLPMVLNERIRNGDFPLYSIVQVKSGAVQEMSAGKYVLFIVTMDLLQQAQFKYGQPTPYVAAPAGAAAAADAPMHCQQPPPPQPQPLYGLQSYGAQQPQYSQQPPPAAYGGGGGSYHPPPPPQQQPASVPVGYGAAAAGGYGAPAAGGGGGGYGAPAAGGYGAPPGRGGVTGGVPDLSSAGATVQPITSLNPYGSRWTIKARVTSKTDMKSWNNAKGSGTLFSIDLLDEWGGEIRATFFKEASDKFFSLITVGRVYLMSGGSLKVANKKFTSIRNEYELQFSERSSITPVDDDGRISSVQFNLVKINVLESVPVDTMVDVAGVVLQPGQATTINTKAGKSMLKRDVQIADDTGHAITLTLWDQGASREFTAGSVVALKGAKLGAFGGRSLSTYGSTIVAVDPPYLPATQALHAWYASGASASVRSISEERGGSGGGGAGRDAAVTSAELRKTVAALRENENICATDRDSHCVKAMITYIKTAEPEKLWYPACPGQVEGRSGSCNKKMMESAGSWSCPNNCNTSQPVYRYIMTCKIQDFTGASFVTFFDQEAKELLGYSADDMRQMLIQSGSAEPSPEFEAVFRGPQNKDLLIWANVKNEMVKDEYRLKLAAKRAKVVNYAQENRALLELLKKYPTA